MRYAGRVGRIQCVDIDGNIEGRLQIKGRRLSTAAGLDNLDAESFELVAMLVIDRMQSHLDESIRQALLHDTCERRGVGSPIALIRFVDIGMRIDMQDRQTAVTATYRTQNGMCDGMITAEANQWITGIHDMRHFALDDIPRIGKPVELDIAMIDQAARGTHIKPGLAPTAIAVGNSRRMSGGASEAPFMKEELSS